MRTMRVASFFIALALWACGSSDVAKTQDTTTDPDVTDIHMDGTDVPPDAIPDPTPDVVPDSTPDIVSPDVTPDSTPDPTPDVTPDVVPDTTSAGYVGDPCSSPTSCTQVPGSGRACLTDLFGMISFPGGYCSADCTSDTDCGTIGDCVDFYGYGSYCLRPCTAPSDCRTSEGYSCSPIPGGPTTPTYCLPPIGGPDSTPVDP